MTIAIENILIRQTSFAVHCLLCFYRIIAGSDVTVNNHISKNGLLRWRKWRI